jgi:hypothetical protein
VGVKVKITVTGKSGCFVQDIADVREDGDLTDAIKVLLAAFREKCNESTFESTIKVEHA